MRIGLLGTRGVPARYGGFETAAEEIGYRLVERGHEVIVYCRNPDQDLTEYRGMHLVNLPALRSQATETLSHTGISVGHALARDHLDVAFLFNAANAPFLPALRAARIPVAVHVDGLEWLRGKWGKNARRYYRWAEGRSAKWGDAIIADAHGIADHMKSVYGVDSYYLAYGAPIVSPPAELLARVPAGVPAEPGKYHVAVARFEPENHVREIVAGYLASKAAMPLLVVGDAAYSDDYRDQVRAAAGDDPRVHFLGSVWDGDLLDALYAHAASYLHGHSVGGTNPSLLRALGAGAPVTGFDVSFNREVVGDAGLWFKDPAGVAVACETVESDPKAAHERGLRGQADVAVRYRWDDVTAGYEALAKDLYEAKRQRKRRRRGA